MNTHRLVTHLVLVGVLLPAAALAQIVVPPDFEATTFVVGPSVSYVTGLAIDSDGVLHASEADVLQGTGRVLRLEDQNADGVADSVAVVASGFGLVTGITFRGIGFPIAPAAPCSASSSSVVTDLERIRRGDFSGQALDLFVSHFTPGPGGGGGIARMSDTDGDRIVDLRTDVVIGLPSDGDNGNQQIAVGFDGLLYFGQGSRTNAGVAGPGQPADEIRNGTILRVAADGSGLEVYARGFRNPFDVMFTPNGELLATENGPDPSGPNPVLDAPDELNAIVADGDYGWPTHFGFPPTGSGTVGPIALFEPSTSTDGLALVTPASWCGYDGDVIAAQFGSFSNTAIGRRLVLVRVLSPRAVQVDVFATGFGRPLDVAFGADGALYVADFSNAFFSPSSAKIYRIRPKDTDGDGVSDLCQSLTWRHRDRR